MIGFGITYIVCGILYTIACVMDGQDVKPLWNRWAGKKLEKAANYFSPIKYVTETKYVPMPLPTPFERCNYDHLTFDAVKVQSQAMISEGDFMMALRHMPYQKKDIANILIKDNKSKCNNEEIKNIFNLSISLFDSNII